MSSVEPCTAVGDETIRSTPFEVTAEELAPTPVIRLFQEQVLVAQPSTACDRYEEPTLALIALAFDYAGKRIGSSDPDDQVIVSTRLGLRAFKRDQQAELEARAALETFGVVELRCLDDYAMPPDAEADYLIRVDGDRHALCAFAARALPRLEALGWIVEIDPSYPYQVVRTEPQWQARLAPADARPDWFQLELGLDVEGEQIDLLPTLLSILEDGRRSLASLVGRPGSLYALPISGTHHVPIDPTSLQALLDVVVELYEGPVGGTLRLSELDAHALYRLQEGFRTAGTELQFIGEETLRSRGKSMAGRGGAPLAPPAGLRATLRPYQADGVAWLQRLRELGAGGVLADDMGLGKTLQTITHLLKEREAGRIGPANAALIVAPTSLVHNWGRELDRFAPSLRKALWQGPKRNERVGELDHCDVVITSYPLLVRDEELLAERRFGVLILDEAQAIKNRRSRVSQAAKRIVAEHRLALTGTPIENHLGELWSLFDFLSPGWLGNEAEFRQRYRVPIERYGDVDKLSALQRRVTPFLLRRLKRDVAKELPPKTEILVPVELEGKQRELYEHIRVAAHGKVRSMIRQKGLSASTLPILDALMKLRQVCCDPKLVRMDAARFVRESAKHERFLSLVDSLLADGHRILVFSQFTSMLALIANSLHQRKLPFLSLTGATPKRQAVIDRFNAGEADLFLISLKAGGTGLNLVSADAVIHYDHWWNPQAQAQATDRAYRIGQDKRVFVHHLYVAGSVEERMLALQRRKHELAEAVLGAESRPLDEAQIEELLAPLSDA